MYRQFLKFIFLCCVTSTFSQTNQATKLLVDQNTTMTISEIVQTFKEPRALWLTGKSWEEDNKYDLLDPLLLALQLDVLNYFLLNEKYDSELKKSVFKKSSDYKELEDSLIKLKNELINSTFYQIGPNNVYQAGIEYDMQKKGFLVALGEVLPYHCMAAFLPKVFGNIEFGQLNIVKKYNLDQSKNSYTQYLFIPMPEEQAIEIENNKESVDFMLVFNLQGTKTITYNDSDFIKDKQANCKVNLVKGGDLRFILYNSKSNEIYYDKLFKKNIVK